MGSRVINIEERLGATYGATCFRNSNGSGRFLGGCSLQLATRGLSRWFITGQIHIHCLPGNSSLKQFDSLEIAHGS